MLRLNQESSLIFPKILVNGKENLLNQIVLVAYSYEFESVTKEIVVTVQKRYTDIDLTAQGNMADVQVTAAYDCIACHAAAFNIDVTVKNSNIFQLAS